MNTNLVISGMFMEMSRGFINQEIEFQNQKNLNSTTDIPEIVKLNIKFTQFAGSVIFSISSLEAFVNLKIYDILYDRFQIDKFDSLPNYNVIKNNINEFKLKYSDKKKRGELFKNEKLTKKINKLYKCFDLKLLSESPIDEDKKLWNNLEKLQSIRNELVHPKPDFIESDNFKNFFYQTDTEFNESLFTPMKIREKLFKDTPLFQANQAQNVILDKYVFKYKGDAILEHNLLTSTEYNFVNVLNWQTRWIF
ncbi:MAG: hypothetical protein HND52_10205 [Ignavibacteriae bacterium]|nr:hypothetical protein [Ignavibacteriota bacterium]NOG98320.1 hypothetical protein [Ignavibacteriota bacterium]